MTRCVTLILGSLLAITSATFAAEESDIDLIAEARASGLWTDDGTAAAVSIPMDNRTGVYVLLVRPNGEYTIADISRIERGLFTTLGLATPADYEKYETQPVEWITLEDGNLLLKVRLQAWRDGQRYTVSAPVIIRPDGSVLWQ